MVQIPCLDELRKHQVNDQKLYDQKVMGDKMRQLAWEGLQKNIVMDDHTMIDKLIRGQVRW